MRVQNALLKNNKYDSDLHKYDRFIESTKHDREKYYLDKFNETSKWLEKIQARSSQFEPMKLTELNKIMKNQSLYKSGKWQSAVDKMKYIRRNQQIIKRVNLNKSMPSQLPLLKSLCQDDRSTMFGAIKQIADIKARQSRQVEDFVIFPEINLTNSIVNKKPT